MFGEEVLRPQVTVIGAVARAPRVRSSWSADRGRMADGAHTTLPPSCLGADVESRCVRPTGRAVLDGEACRHGGRDACGPYATSDRSPWTRAQLAPSAVPPPGPDPPVSTQLPRARVIRKPKAECAMETVCVPWPSTWALDHQRFFAKWAFRDLVDCHELISFSLARSSSCAVCADGGRVNLSSELGYKRAQLTDGPGSGAFVK